MAGTEQLSYDPGLVSVLLRCILGMWAHQRQEAGSEASQELQ